MLHQTHFTEICTYSVQPTTVQILTSNCNQYKYISHLEEVLNPLRVVAVALATDSLHLFDLTGLARRLDIFKVDLCLLTEVDD